MMAAFRETLRMIKVEHSVFALPFALIGAFAAAEGVPSPRLLGLIVLAMVFARSAAMAFNRLVDARLDALNPRTADRSIPAGRLSAEFTLVFTLMSSGLFVLTAYFINNLAFALSIPVLLILLGYSLTKRFTSYSHLVLGLALGLAPVGAWIAVRGSLDFLPWLLTVAVTSWTAGFDIIYACQDVDFDRKQRLHSIPARLGIPAALSLARMLHLIMVMILLLFGALIQSAWPYWVGWVLVVVCLIYEHSLVWGGNLRHVNLAFFTINGVVSLLFGVTTMAALVLAG